MYIVGDCMIIVLVSIVLLYFLITYLCFLVLCRRFNEKLVSKVRRDTYNETDKYQDKIDETNNWFKKQTVEKVFIKSIDNIKLNGLLIRNKKEKGIFIIFHGYRSDATSHLFLSYPHFYDLGYSILLVNQRTCSASGGKYTTFGAKEKDDVICWIKYVNENFKKQDIILAGISMGATAILLATKYITKDMNIKLMIADSGYISGYEAVRDSFKAFIHINGTIFMPGINLWCKLFAKFNLKKINTLEEMTNCGVPLLLFHVKDDRFVSADNSIKNYDAYTGKKDIILFDESNHATCYLSNPDKYINSINKYIK